MSIQQQINNSPSTITKQSISQLDALLKQLQRCVDDKKSNVEQQFTNLLNEMSTILNKMNILHLSIKPQHFIYDILKPLTRQITNFNPCQINTLQVMKSTLQVIITVYMKIFTQYHLQSVLEIVKELLQRENMLFAKSFKRGAGAVAAGVTASQVQKKLLAQQNTLLSQLQEKKYTFSRGRLGYTTFHRDCCEIIFYYINKLPQQQFNKMKLTQIKQLMNFMHYFQDYIYQQKLQQFIEQSYNSLKTILTLSSQYQKIEKHLIKQSTKQLFEQLQQKMTKLLFYSSNKQLKINILLLGPQFAHNLLINSQTIQTKLHAIKILQKFANHYYYRGIDIIKIDTFAQWLLNKGLWDILINKNCQLAIVKSSQYILKLIVNKRTNKIVSQQKFKHFLLLIWQVSQQVRKCYIKSLDPLKLTYTNLSLLIDRLKHIQQNGELYVEEFFYLLQQISRYGTDSQRRVIVDILLNILKKHYSAWKSYSTQRKAMDSLKYCFEKLADGIKDTTQRGQLYVQLINEFITTPNYLTLTISRKLFQSQQKKNSYALEKAARMLVEKKRIIQTIIELMSQQVSYGQQLLYFLKTILEKYKSYNCTISLSLPEDIMLKATKYPQVFTQLVTFSSPKDCQPLLQKLIQSSYQIQINFQSIKQLFYKVNYLFIKTIEPEYFRRKQYRVKINPQQLYYVKDLQLLLTTCKYQTIQQQCAELIADIYTSFSQVYIQKGRLITRQFMQQILSRIQTIRVDQNYFKKQQNKIQLYGLLCLVKQLLYATQIHGVGQLKPHNALITTSLIKVKIWNNAAYGDDVQKCFQKNVPSNMTLFQLLTQLTDKFKCGQHQLYLQQGNCIGLPAKYNGRTLLQLGFGNFRQFSAYKNTTVQIQKQPLKLSNNQLNPLFIKIINQIFTKYAKDNKLGLQQIINYIRGVTNSPSHNKDSRVLILLKQYDIDNDGYLTLQDMLRFYHDSCDGGHKEDNIWLNLENLHYRKDLRRFDQPIGPVVNQDLFRYYVKNSQFVYELLFNICNCHHLKNEEKLIQLSKSILGHLPTCQNLVADFQQPLDFTNKTSFQISYILINVRYFLQKEIQQETSQLLLQSDQRKKQLVNNNDDDRKDVIQQEQKQKIQQHQQQSQQNQQSSPNQQQKNVQKTIQQQKNVQKTNQQINNKKLSYIKKFITNKNDLILYNLIYSLSKINKKTQQQQLLFTVSINILRKLLNLPSLTQDYLHNDKYNIQYLQQIITNKNILNIQSYQLFIKLIVKNIRQTNNNIELLQALLALALNQKYIQQQQWIEIGLFHSQINVRKLMLNFFIFYCIQYNFPIDFFQLNIKVNPKRCQQWYLLLLFFLSYRKVVSITVLESILSILETQSQDISSQGFYNPIMNGNLNLLVALVQINPTFVLARRKKLYHFVKSLMERTLSNHNRILGYRLMFNLNPKGLLQYMYNLIKSIKPTQKYQIKQNFVGIKNLGSTCYMNSILQQFFTIEKFKKMILTFPLKEIPAKSLVNDTEIVDDFLYQLQKMYTYLQLSKKKYYLPKQFCLTIKDYNKKPINTSIQQDAHEFLNNLFDKIETYMKSASLLPQLQKIFQGKTVCEIACGQCETKKSKIQDFYHLALQVKHVGSLQQSFHKFISPQTIQDYYCEKCQHKSKQITKQTLLSELPQVLIINLQRIVFDLQSFRKVKVHSKLEFPQQLSLKEYLHMQSECLKKSSFSYKLKGVVIHSGTSQGGHYYSLIKINNQWYKFNDQTVSRFNITELQKQAFGGNSDGWGDSQFSTNAYILFYDRVGIKQGRVGQQGQGLRMVEQQQLQQNYCDGRKGGQRMSEQVVMNSIQEQKLITTNHQPIKPTSSQQKQTLKSIFTWQVQQQNNHFYKQLQLHQQSFFTFITSFYHGARPTEILQSCKQQPFYQQWKQLVGLENYQLVMKIFIQIIKFIRVFYQLPQKVINQIGTAMYELLTLLPQQALHLIKYSIDKQQKQVQDQQINNNINSNSNKAISLNQWSQTICTHSQINIRQLYKVILNKCIYVYVKYNQWKFNQNNYLSQSKSKSKSKQQIVYDSTLHNEQQTQQVQFKQYQHLQQHNKHDNKILYQQQDHLTKLLHHFLNPTTLQLVTKNIYKSYYFFQFWLVNIQINPQIQSFCLQNNLLFILLDLLMANQSPFINLKQKKRHDLPYEMVGPLLQAIVKLLNRKKNSANKIPFKNTSYNQQQYHPLTTQQQKILTSPAFYKRMISLKYDNGLLSQIVCFMCYSNQQFSTNICQMFLIGLNNIDQIENSLSLLNNIKAFLLIDDELKEKRVKWMLGIPQFDHAAKMSYALRHSNQSSNIVYVSSRFFIGDEKYRPALQVLHDKRCYFSDFEVHGIMTLLEIVLNNDYALRHILSIPPPSYLYRNYLSWIENYSIKLSTQDHYGLTMDKKFLAQSLQNLLKQVLAKVQTVTDVPKAPILPKIIGRNKNLFMQEEIQNQVYIIKKWVHETYVLDNLPLQNSQKGNLSLPDELFSIKSPKDYAQYFIENNDIKQPSDIQIPTQNTINTLQIDTKKPLKLTFILPSFSHQIYINKGLMYINYAFSDFYLQEYLEIQIKQEEQNDQGKEKLIQMKQTSKMKDNDKNNKMQIQDTYGPSNDPNARKDYEFNSGYGNIADTAGYGTNNDNGFDIPCEVCTYLNYPGRNRCEMCDSPL